MRKRQVQRLVHGMIFTMATAVTLSWMAMFVTACSAQPALPNRNPPNPELAKLKPEMRYLENDRLRLGIDLSIGGAVTFLADKAHGGPELNMINSVDWGRQIQLSYYSGPNPFIGPNGEQPTESWAGLGWNPIQAGDAGGYSSQVTLFEYVTDPATDERSMVVECIPKQWPHHNVPGDCTFRCVYTFCPEGNAFRLTATIRLNRLDHTQYHGRSQEMPALYTNGPWYRLVAYQGLRPFENQPLRTIVGKDDGKGWPWTQAYIPERWSALVNDAGTGVGVCQPDSLYITAGFHGGDPAKGMGGPKDGQTGYIAPLSNTILDWNGESTYETYFIVGSLEEIRDFAYRHVPHTSSTRWIFASDRQGWVYEGTTDAGWPISGELAINVSAEHSSTMIGPLTFWEASQRKTLEMEVSVTPTGPDATKKTGDVTGDAATVDFGVHILPVAPEDLLDSTDLQAMAEAPRAALRKKPVSVTAPVPVDGNYHAIPVALNGLTGYDGAMKQIRILLPECDSVVRLRRIELK